MKPHENYIWHFERLGWKEEVQGVVYATWNGKVSHYLLVRVRPGYWNIVGMNKFYDKQPDGWFLVEYDGYFSLRGDEKSVMLDEMDHDMDSYINELITVQE